MTECAAPTEIVVERYIAPPAGLIHPLPALALPEGPIYCPALLETAHNCLTLLSMAQRHRAALRELGR